MTCSYAIREPEWRCTYRKMHHVKDYELLLSLCQGLPADCPWHVQMDKRSREYTGKMTKTGRIS